MSLGIHLPRPEGGNSKKPSFGFAGTSLGDAIDKMPLRAAPSEKAMTMAGMLKKPSWRWTSDVEREFKETQPVDSTAKNMKWPRVAPAWLKHDKHCLRFYGYFQEHVVERWDENSRFRQVVFNYFLEDGTISATEPKVENSGLMQGPFLKRHHAPRADGSGNLDPGDFIIGEELILYGVAHHITGADRFTRWFFEQNGWPLGEDEAPVKDQWHKTHTFNKMAEKGGIPMSQSSMEAKILTKFMLGAPPADKKLVQFLQNDRKVLRFKAYWDDNTLYGNRFYFTIHYYLADNTAEINEAHARNSGRDAYPVFAKRGPLKKENRTNCYPGMLEPTPDVYLPKDMIVGSYIEYWRRKLYIYECDDFTQTFYKDYMGIDQKSNCIDVAEIPKVHQKLTPPPHNGIGYPEDSLMNCVMIAPKAAKQDLAKMMMLTGEVLRFEARMVNGEPEDENRRFIVGYYPADEHMACWELQVRNSGHMAGKFSEKKRMTNPDTGKYFQLHELAIGRAVTIASQPLLILRADEHTLRFLEKNTEDFPMADPYYCAQRLAPLAGDRSMHDEAGVSPDDLKAVADHCGIGILDHEIITLLRHFAVSQPGATPLISGPRIMEVLQSSPAQDYGDALDQFQEY